MKLYYMQGACSLAVHIVLMEIGVPFAIESVDGETKKTESGQDFTILNPNGYVPALMLDDGDVITECTAILQYLADANPSKNLAPISNLVARANVNSLLNFTSSELHPRAAAFFYNPTVEGVEKEKIVSKLGERVTYIESILADGRAYLTGNDFTIADVYAYVVLTWPALFDVSLSPWPNTLRFVTRIGERTTTLAALKAEGFM